MQQRVFNTNLWNHSGAGKCPSEPRWKDFGSLWGLNHDRSFPLSALKVTNQTVVKSCGDYLLLLNVPACAVSPTGGALRGGAPLLPAGSASPGEAVCCLELVLFNIIIPRLSHPSRSCFLMEVGGPALPAVGSPPATLRGMRRQRGGDQRQPAHAAFGLVPGGVIPLPFTCTVVRLHSLVLNPRVSTRTLPPTSSSGLPYRR